MLLIGQAVILPFHVEGGNLVERSQKLGRKCRPGDPLTMPGRVQRAPRRSIRLTEKFCSERDGGIRTSCPPCREHNSVFGFRQLCGEPGFSTVFEHAKKNWAITLENQTKVRL